MFLSRKTYRVGIDWAQCGALADLPVTCLPGKIGRDGKRGQMYGMAAREIHTLPGSWVQLGPIGTKFRGGHRGLTYLVSKELGDLREHRTATNRYQLGKFFGTGTSSQ